MSKNIYTSTYLEIDDQCSRVPSGSGSSDTKPVLLPLMTMVETYFCRNMYHRRNPSMMRLRTMEILFISETTRSIHRQFRGIAQAQSSFGISSPGKQFAVGGECEVVVVAQYYGDDRLVLECR